MTVKLAEFLRLSLRYGALDTISLTQEISLTTHFLAIEKIRHGNRLQSPWKIDDAAADCRIAPLLLQPLVENAIRHGIDGLLGGGTIGINATRTGDQLHLCIENPVDAGALPKEGTGVGLDNVRRRIAGLYGTDGGSPPSAMHPASLCGSTSPSGRLRKIDSKRNPPMKWHIMVVGVLCSSLAHGQTDRQGIYFAKEIVSAVPPSGVRSGARPSAFAGVRRESASGRDVLEGMGACIPSLSRAGAWQRLCVAIHRCRIQQEHLPLGHRIHEYVLQCSIRSRPRHRIPRQLLRQAA